MEPKFEIRFYPTYRMFAEYYRKIGVGPRFPVLILLGFAVVGINLLSAYSGRVNLMELILLVLYLLILMLPYLMAWLNLRSLKQNNNHAIPETRIAVGDTLTLDEGAAHLTAEYRNICRVVHLRHSYVLMLGKRNGMMIDPNGFTKGSFANFKKHLRKKRPDLTIPD